MMNIEKNINKASTLPGSFYSDAGIFRRLKSEVFLRSWQFVTEEDSVKSPTEVYPFYFMEGFIDEPLLLTRDENDQLHCISNVCTHRGNLLMESPAMVSRLTCNYHGRCFHLNGQFKSMPETDGMENFPCEADNLPGVPFGKWGKFLFASVDPIYPFEEFIKEMDQRVGWLPLDEFVYDPNRSQDYLIKANWALYCDNYLEGFHIPYIHKGLAKELDYSNYTTEVYKFCNLQLGIAKGADHVFDLPESSPDHGKNVAAYYYWLFPNLMFNFYPWGLSVNIVKPIGVNLTKVSFRTYVWDESKINSGAGAVLDRVEREDETIVERVQKGTNAHLYTKGRFSPAMEKGVHHFHRLLSAFLTGRNTLD